jgi:hypothetical protein
LDGRQRVGRLRPRSLDWVVGDARPRLRLHAPTPPPIPLGSQSFVDWLSSFWTPVLRVLEVCDGPSMLAVDARSHRTMEFVCLKRPGDSSKSEEVGRLGWTCVQGEPSALVRCGMQFDLIAWRRQEERSSSIFDAAERLLAPRGLLAVQTATRIDARVGSRWHIQGVSTLSDGTLGVSLRRRTRSQAA